jgi:hypothetical protein
VAERALRAHREAAVRKEAEVRTLSKAYSIAAAAVRMALPEVRAARAEPAAQAALEVTGAS